MIVITCLLSCALEIKYLNFWILYALTKHYSLFRAVTAYCILERFLNITFLVLWCDLDVETSWVSCSVRLILVTRVTNVDLLCKVILVRRSSWLLKLLLNIIGVSWWLRIWILTQFRSCCLIECHCLFTWHWLAAVRKLLMVSTNLNVNCLTHPWRHIWNTFRWGCYWHSRNVLKLLSA